MYEIDFGDGSDHRHLWGPLERSTLAGTVHRKCQVGGCRFVNALDDDEWNDSYPEDEHDRWGGAAD